MAEILETVMLICFGCSWPISLINNIRAKSAKNTSLGFILLILLGYAGGISAKLLNQHYGLVLIAYIINIIMVIANLVVYFLNKKHDQQTAKISANNSTDSKIYNKSSAYKQAA